MFTLASADSTSPLARLGLSAEWLAHITVALVWGAVLLTIYSGVGYIFAALRLMRQ
jgi:hypothetical protein